VLVRSILIVPSPDPSGNDESPAAVTSANGLFGAIELEKMVGAAGIAPARTTF